MGRRHDGERLPNLLEKRTLSNYPHKRPNFFSKNTSSSSSFLFITLHIHHPHSFRSSFLSKRSFLPSSLFRYQPHVLHFHTSISSANTMQFRLLLTLLSAGITLANIGKRELICNHDNCLRALIATQKGPAHSSMVATDCSKFLATAAPLPTHPPAQVKRGVSAIGLPLYASACSNPVRYESACACVGVFPASVTVYVVSISVLLS